MKDTLRAIRRKFRVRAQHDSMPVACLNGTRMQLADLWGEIGYTRGAEIGVARGSFTREMLERIPNSIIVCVDVWEPVRDDFRDKEMQERNYNRTIRKLRQYAERGRVKILRTNSMDALQYVDDESMDFVWIDGDHTYDWAATDIIWWSRKVRRGGIVAVHDYIPMRRGGVMEAVNAYTQYHGIHPWFVTREPKYPTAFWVRGTEQI